MGRVCRVALIQYLLVNVVCLLLAQCWFTVGPAWGQIDITRWEGVMMGGGGVGEGAYRSRMNTHECLITAAV